MWLKINQEKLQANNRCVRSQDFQRSTHFKSRKWRAIEFPQRPTITACQRRCRKVMFSVVFVCLSVCLGVSWATVKMFQTCSLGNTVPCSIFFTWGPPYLFLKKFTWESGRLFLDWKAFLFVNYTMHLQGKRQSPERTFPHFTTEFLYPQAPGKNIYYTVFWLFSYV